MLARILWVQNNAQKYLQLLVVLLPYQRILKCGTIKVGSSKLGACDDGVCELSMAKICICKVNSV